MDGPIGHSLMVADRLDLLRLAVVSILSVGLSPGVADDLPSLARVNALGDAFSVGVTGLRGHTFSNYSMLSIPAAHGVLCDMVNRDIGLWVSELMRAAQRSSPAVVPFPAGTVFDPPRLPMFVRKLEFCRGGGGAGAQARGQQHRCQRRQAFQAEGQRSARWISRVHGKSQFEPPRGLPDVRAHR